MDDSDSSLHSGFLHLQVPLVNVQDVSLSVIQAACDMSQAVLSHRAKQEQHRRVDSAGGSPTSVEQQGCDHESSAEAGHLSPAAASSTGQAAATPASPALGSVLGVKPHPALLSLSSSAQLPLEEMLAAAVPAGQESADIVACISIGQRDGRVQVAMDHPFMTWEEAERQRQQPALGAHAASRSPMFVRCSDGTKAADEQFAQHVHDAMNALAGKAPPITPRVVRSPSFVGLHQRAVEKLQYHHRAAQEGEAADPDQNSHCVSLPIVGRSQSAYNTARVWVLPARHGARSAVWDDTFRIRVRGVTPNSVVQVSVLDVSARALNSQAGAGADGTGPASSSSRLLAVGMLPFGQRLASPSSAVSSLSRSRWSLAWAASDQPVHAGLPPHDSVFQARHWQFPATETAHGPNARDLTRELVRENLTQVAQRQGAVAASHVASLMQRLHMSAAPSPPADPLGVDDAVGCASTASVDFASDTRLVPLPASLHPAYQRSQVVLFPAVHDLAPVPTRVFTCLQQQLAHLLPHQAAEQSQRSSGPASVAPTASWRRRADDTQRVLEAALENLATAPQADAAVAAGAVPLISVPGSAASTAPLPKSDAAALDAALGDDRLVLVSSGALDTLALRAHLRATMPLVKPGSVDSGSSRSLPAASSEKQLSPSIGSRGLKVSVAVPQPLYQAHVNWRYDVDRSEQVMDAALLLRGIGIHGKHPLASLPEDTLHLLAAALLKPRSNDITVHLPVLEPLFRHICSVRQNARRGRADRVDVSAATMSLYHTVMGSAALADTVAQGVARTRLHREAEFTAGEVRRSDEEQQAWLRWLAQGRAGHGGRYVTDPHSTSAAQRAGSHEDPNDDSPTLEQAHFVQLLSYCTALPHAAIESVFERMDSNGDRSLSWEEFVSYLLQEASTGLHLRGAQGTYQISAPSSNCREDMAGVENGGAQSLVGMPTLHAYAVAYMDASVHIWHDTLAVALELDTRRSATPLPPPYALVSVEHPGRTSGLTPEFRAEFALAAEPGARPATAGPTTPGGGGGAIRQGSMGLPPRASSRLGSARPSTAASRASTNMVAFQQGLDRKRAEQGMSISAVQRSADNSVLNLSLSGPYVRQAGEAAGARTGMHAAGESLSVFGFSEDQAMASHSSMRAAAEVIARYHREAAQETAASAEADAAAALDGAGKRGKVKPASARAHMTDSTSATIDSLKPPVTGLAVDDTYGRHRLLVACADRIVRVYDVSKWRSDGPQSLREVLRRRNEQREQAEFLQHLDAVAAQTLAHTTAGRAGRSTTADWSDVALPLAGMAAGPGAVPAHLYASNPLVSSRLRRRESRRKHRRAALEAAVAAHVAGGASGPSENVGASLDVQVQSAADRASTLARRHKGVAIASDDNALCMLNNGRQTAITAKDATHVSSSQAAMSQLLGDTTPVNLARLSEAARKAALAHSQDQRAQMVRQRQFNSRLPAGYIGTGTEIAQGHATDVLLADEAGLPGRPRRELGVDADSTAAGSGFRLPVIGSDLRHIITVKPTAAFGTGPGAPAAIAVLQKVPHFTPEGNYKWQGAHSTVAGTLYAVGDSAGWVSFYTPATLHCAARVRTPLDTVLAIEQIPGVGIAVAGLGGPICIIDLQTFALGQTLAPEPDQSAKATLGIAQDFSTGTHSVAWCERERCLISCNHLQRPVMWDVKQPAAPVARLATTYDSARLAAPADAVASITVSDKHNHVLVCTVGGRISLYDSRSFRCLQSASDCVGRARNTLMTSAQDALDSAAYAGLGTAMGETISNGALNASTAGAGNLAAAGGATRAVGMDVSFASNTRAGGGLTVAVDTTDTGAESKVLHARTSYDPGTGSNYYLRGCSLDLRRQCYLLYGSHARRWAISPVEGNLDARQGASQGAPAMGRESTEELQAKVLLDAGAGAGAGGRARADDALQWLCVLYSAAFEYIVGVSVLGRVCVYSLRSGQMVVAFDAGSSSAGTNAAEARPTAQAAQAGRLTAAALDRLGRRLFTASMDGSLRTWNLSNGALLHEYPRLNLEITCAAVHPAEGVGSSVVLGLWHASLGWAADNVQPTHDALAAAPDTLADVAAEVEKEAAEVDRLTAATIGHNMGIAGSMTTLEGGSRTVEGTVALADRLGMAHPLKPLGSHITGGEALQEAFSRSLKSSQRQDFGSLADAVAAADLERKLDQSRRLTQRASRAARHPMPGSGRCPPSARPGRTLRVAGSARPSTAPAASSRRRADTDDAQAAAAVLKPVPAAWGQRYAPDATNADVTCIAVGGQDTSPADGSGAKPEAGAAAGSRSSPAWVACGTTDGRLALWSAMTASCNSCHLLHDAAGDNLGALQPADISAIAGVAPHSCIIAGTVSGALHVMAMNGQMLCLPGTKRTDVAVDMDEELARLQPAGMPSRGAGAVVCMAFEPTRAMLWVAYSNRVLRAFALGSAQDHGLLDMLRAPAAVCVLSQEEGPATSITPAPDAGVVLVSAGETLQVWSVEFEQLASLQAAQVPPSWPERLHATTARSKALVAANASVVVGPSRDKSAVSRVDRRLTKLRAATAMVGSARARSGDAQPESTLEAKQDVGQETGPLAAGAAAGAGPGQPSAGARIGRSRGRAWRARAKAAQAAKPAVGKAMGSEEAVETASGAIPPATLVRSLNRAMASDGFNPSALLRSSAVTAVELHQGDAVRAGANLGDAAYHQVEAGRIGSPIALRRGGFPVLPEGSPAPASLHSQVGSMAKFSHWQAPKRAAPVPQHARVPLEYLGSGRWRRLPLTNARNYSDWQHSRKGHQRSSLLQLSHE